MPRLREPIKTITATAGQLLNGLLRDPDEDLMFEFSRILSEFREIISVYETLLPEFIAQSTDRTVRSTYAQAGDCVHRGIMCPSPVLNLMVGCNRGTLIDSPDLATENYFRYDFDANGELIAVNHYDISSSRQVPDEVEFIYRRDEIEFGITYNLRWNEISRISKVALREDGDPIYYAASDYDQAEPELMYLHFEEYRYHDDVPVQADVYFGVSPELNMYEHHTFHVTMESDKREDKLTYPRQTAQAILRQT